MCSEVSIDVVSYGCIEALIDVSLAWFSHTALNARRESRCH